MSFIRVRKICIIMVTELLETVIGIEDQAGHYVQLFYLFARHGRALMGESPEHAQIVGSV